MTNKEKVRELYPAAVALLTDRTCTGPWYTVFDAFGGITAFLGEGASPASAWANAWENVRGNQERT